MHPPRCPYRGNALPFGPRGGCIISSIHLPPRDIVTCFALFLLTQPSLNLSVLARHITKEYYLFVVTYPCLFKLVFFLMSCLIFFEYCLIFFSSFKPSEVSNINNICLVVSLNQSICVSFMKYYIFEYVIFIAMFILRPGYSLLLFSLFTFRAEEY